MEQSLFLEWSGGGCHSDPVEVIPLRWPEKPRQLLVSRSSSQQFLGLPPCRLNSERSESAHLRAGTLGAVPGFPRERGGQEGQMCSFYGPQDGQGCRQRKWWDSGVGMERSMNQKAEHVTQSASLALALARGVDAPVDRG